MRDQQRRNAIQIAARMAARQLHASRAKAGRLTQVNVGDKQRAFGGPEQHALREADERSVGNFDGEFANHRGLTHAVYNLRCLTACRSFGKKLDGVAWVMRTVGV